MNWTLIGYEAAGDAKLGMTPDQVAAVIGAADTSHVSHSSGRLLEYRPVTEPDLTYDEGQLIEISFTPDVSQPVIWDDITVFDVPKSVVLDRILELEKNLYVTFGMLVAYDLGIFLNGFHSDQDKPRIGLFARNYYDYMLLDTEIMERFPKR